MSKSRCDCGRASLTACATGAGGRLTAGAAEPKFYADDPIGRITIRKTPRRCRSATSTLSTTRSRTRSTGRATTRRTSGHRTSIPWTRCRTRTGSPTASAPAPMTVDELLRGPDTIEGPAPGNWTVIAAKNDGVTPGFTVRDAAGQVWFLKFDPPGYRGMATGTEVVVTKLFWALGYFLPEVHLASLRPEQLTIDDDATITPPSGNKRTVQGVGCRRAAPQRTSGSRRLLPGHRQQGPRRPPVGRLPVLRHAIRRSERHGAARAPPRVARLRTFSAWVNHVDSKSINTLDTLIEQDDQQVVRHNLLDFGSTLGSAGVYPREAFEGSEYLVDGKKPWPASRRSGFTSRTGARCRSTGRASVGAFPSTTRRGIPRSGDRGTPIRPSIRPPG